MAGFKFALAGVATVASACGGCAHQQHPEVSIFTNSTQVESLDVDLSAREKAHLKYLSVGHWPANATNTVFPNLPRWHVNNGYMPLCSDCGKRTVMVAYDSHEEDGPKTLCATCADKAPKCGHSQPRPTYESHEILGAPTLKGGNAPDEWTYQPSGTSDMVLCDGCMGHMIEDVIHFVQTGQFDATEAFVMREHNAQVQTEFPYRTSFDSRGQGCINHSGERQVYTAKKDRSVHICTKCHDHLAAGGKAADLFKEGWRVTEEKAGDFTLPALSERRQKQMALSLKAQMSKLIDSVDEWELMTF